MKTFGEFKRDRCPICPAKIIARPRPPTAGPPDVDVGYWRIPVASVEPPVTINGASAGLLPIVGAEMVAVFNRCTVCGSIYLDPIPEAQYQSDQYAFNHIRKPDRVAKYRERWEWCERHIKPEDRTLADVCCGAGELVELAGEHKTENGFTLFSKIYGLEWSNDYVDNINPKPLQPPSGRIIGVQIDLNEVEASSVIPPCDVILFMEAFEHQRFPGEVIVDLARALAGGGRLLFSAQSSRGNLPVRPYETVYVDETALMMLLKRAGLALREMHETNGRWLVAAEKIKE